jgi:hypothetical protein
MRTRVIDELVSELNAGRIVFAKGLTDENDIRTHLSKPKRIMNMDSVGEESAQWVSQGDDHYFFALLYAFVADKLAAETTKFALPVGFPSLISKVRLKSAA